MATFVQKKKDYMNALVALASESSSIARKVIEFQAYGLDNGFLTSGANAIVDADCTDSVGHLTASLVNSANTALGNIALTPGQRTTLRQCSTVVIPPVN